MAAVLLTSDLACSSKAAGAAARAGVELSTAMSIAALLDKVSAQAVELVILDLTTPALDPLQLVPQLRALPAPPGAVMAFGPHVHEAKLAAATDAGCELVISRGQFHAQLDELLGRLGRKPEVGIRKSET